MKHLSITLRTLALLLLLTAIALLWASTGAKAQTLKPFKDETTKNWGYKDASGKIIVPAQFYAAHEFSEGMARVGAQSTTDYFGTVIPTTKHGYIDATGNQIIPCQYILAGDFSETLAYVSTNSGYGFIDTKGNTVIPYSYYQASSFSEGLSAVMTEDEKWGYIDKKGILVIPYTYDDAHIFSEGLAAVNIGWNYENDESGLWGYINKTGKMVIPCIYSSADKFMSNGLALVDDQNGETIMIDKTGKRVEE